MDTIINHEKMLLDIVTLYNSKSSTYNYELDETIREVYKNPNIQDKDGRNVLIVFFMNMYNSKYSYNKYLKNNKDIMNIVEYLVNVLKVDVNFQDSCGYTILHHMMLSNYSSVFVTHLLTLGANPNIRSNKGETPLMFVARSCIYYGQSEETIDILLQHGANPNIRDYNNDTALDYAFYGLMDPDYHTYRRIYDKLFMITTNKRQYKKGEYEEGYDEDNNIHHEIRDKDVSLCYECYGKCYGM